MLNVYKSVWRRRSVAVMESKVDRLTFDVAKLDSLTAIIGQLNVNMY